MIHIVANYRIENVYNQNNVCTEDYDTMTELCCKSFKENLVGWENTIILRGVKRHYDQVFKEVFYKLRELCLGNPDRDFIFTDVDTVCVKKTEIKFDTFNMFCIAPDKFNKYPLFVPKELYEDLEPWYMSNVRYLPSRMDKSLWDIGKGIADNWINTWAYECIIYNRMYKEQKGGEGHLPMLNSQWYGKHRPDENAHIIHIPASRGSKSTLNRMKNLLGEK